MLTSKQKEHVKPVIKKALQNIIFIEQERDINAKFVALTPLAEGADSLFAAVAKELDIQLQVILPFEKDKYLEGFASDETRKEFELIYNEIPASNKKQLNTLNNSQPHELFMKLGQELVSNTDYLLAIWNEKQGKGKGGTADTVAYAMKMKKNLLLINPEDEMPTINYLHYDHRESYKEEGIVYPPDTNHLAAFIIKKQNQFDDSAVEYSKKYRKLWTTGFVAGLVEVLAFSINASVHPPLAIDFLLSTIEFLSLVFILMLVAFGNSKELHHKYVHFRIISERLRIKRFFCELGFKIYDTIVSPIYFTLKENPEFLILDNTIKLINLSAWSYWSFEKKKRYLEDELILNQQHYHERKKAKFIKRNELYKRIRSGMFIAVVICLFVHYFKIANQYFLHIGIHVSDYAPAFLETHLFEEITLFIFLFLPSTIAACEALKYLYEWEKIINLSAAMSEYFKGKANKLKDIFTESELEDFMNSINRDMLIENLDWEKYMHDKDEVPT
ncbi:MAG: hypothetical protein JWQ38_1500 [Flavipsychrobacter sp.]|nr:hypothetical protein [Flavipsychrobacter sp.]